MQTPTYEIFALRYGTHQDRVARANFLSVDDHAAPMPLDYFVWAIRGPVGSAPPRTIVVDTGMGEAAVRNKPGRKVLAPVEAVLGRVGIDPGAVRDVVLTHLHYDHAGRTDLFPAAQFHIQDAEMTYCTGRCMCHDVLRAPFAVEDVVAAVRFVHGGRMRFHDGTAEIAPGVSVHLVGGHTGGLQVVRAPTARGWVVLASDATHYWANIRTRNPFPLVADVAKMLEGYRILESLADGPDHIIPGHDPLVLARFPKAPGQPEAVRLDLPPTL
jgi:glyoxylase-like metal-dependent hydrolase (beta-lactamase superfamily II)